MSNALTSSVRSSLAKGAASVEIRLRLRGGGGPGAPPSAPGEVPVVGPAAGEDPSPPAPDATEAPLPSRRNAKRGKSGYNIPNPPPPSPARSPGHRPDHPNPGPRPPPRPSCPFEPDARNQTTPAVPLAADGVPPSDPRVHGLPALPRPVPPPPAPNSTSAPSTGLPTPRPQLNILLVFSGPGEGEHSLMHQLRARGVNVLAIDTKIGGSAHDVLGPLGTDLVRSIRAKVFHAVFLAPPCSSFSVLHPMHLRSRAQPDGIEPIPPHWQAYVRKHNALAAVSARIFQACHEEGIPVAAENPADRGEEASPAFWAEHSNHGSLWRSSSWAPALEATGATCFTFAQCAFHSPSQKWTTIAAAGGMPHALAGLGSGRFGCHHGREPHQVTLLGHDSLGRSRATMAAAYPPALDLFLANALITAAEASQQHIPIPPPLPSLSCPLPS